MDQDNLDAAKQDNAIADQYRLGAYFYDVIVHFFQLIRPRDGEKNRRAMLWNRRGLT